MSPRFRLPLADRFWSKVAIPDPEQYPDWADQCWLWTDHCDNESRYGRIQVDGGPQFAHRVALALIIGWEAIRNLNVLHSCDNPPCVNPRHLRAGTQKMNVQDMVERGRARGPGTGTADGVSRLMTLDEVDRMLVVRAAGTRMAKSFVAQLAKAVWVNGTTITPIGPTHIGVDLAFGQDYTVHAEIRREDAH